MKSRKRPTGEEAPHLPLLRRLGDLLTVRKERIGKSLVGSRKDKTKALDCGLLMDFFTYGMAGVKLSRRS